MILHYLFLHSTEEMLNKESWLIFAMEDYDVGVIHKPAKKVENLDTLPPIHYQQSSNLVWPPILITDLDIPLYCFG